MLHVRHVASGLCRLTLSAEVRAIPSRQPHRCLLSYARHLHIPKFRIPELDNKPDLVMSSPTMNVALLGTGLYAQSDYIPAFISKETQSVRVHTIWSLDESAAKSCASELSRDGLEPRVLAQKEDIEVILQDPAIDAIVMVLPFMYQPDIIRRAWKAGKHVLSEKPIERDTKAAMALVREYEENWASKGLVWRVAEGTYMSLPDPSVTPEIHWR